MKNILIKFTCLFLLVFSSAVFSELEITFEENYDGDPDTVQVRARHIPSIGDDECMWKNYPCYGAGSNTATPAHWFTSPVNNQYGTPWAEVPAIIGHPAGGTVNQFAESYLGGRGSNAVILPRLNMSSNGGMWFCVGIATRGNFYSKGVHKQCGLIPRTLQPPKPTCTVSPGSIQLNHNSLTAVEAVNHVASQTVRVSCTATGYVSIKATDVVYGKSSFQLRASDKLSNTLTVDGVDGATGKTYSIGTSGVNVVIASKLYSGGPAISAGSFSGNAVMVFEVI